MKTTKIGATIGPRERELRKGAVSEEVFESTSNIDKENFFELDLGSAAALRLMRAAAGASESFTFG